jgi:hypothetical protein
MNNLNLVLLKNDNSDLFKNNIYKYIYIHNNYSILYKKFHIYIKY